MQAGLGDTGRAGRHLCGRGLGQWELGNAADTGEGMGIESDGPEVGGSECAVY